MFTFACISQTKRKRDTRHRVDDVSGFSERFGSENPFLPLRAQRVSAVHVFQKEKVTPKFEATPRRLDARISSFDCIRHVQFGRSVTASNVKISVATTRRITFLTPGC
jgi:hypothetical protein